MFVFAYFAELDPFCLYAVTFLPFTVSHPGCSSSFSLPVLQWPGKNCLGDDALHV